MSVGAFELESNARERTPEEGDGTKREGSSSLTTIISVRLKCCVL